MEIILSFLNWTNLNTIAMPNCICYNNLTCLETKLLMNMKLCMMFLHCPCAALSMKTIKLFMENAQGVGSIG